MITTDIGKQKIIECSQYAVDFMADIFRHFATEEIESLWNLLRKLYEFDGSHQDGFEESGLPLTSDTGLGESILQHFAQKRKSLE